MTRMHILFDNVIKWRQIALIWIGTAALVFVLGKIIAILILRKPI